MIGCLRTRVRKQPIIALYSVSETVLKVYNLDAFFYHGNVGLCVLLVYAFECGFPRCIHLVLVGEGIPMPKIVKCIIVNYVFQLSFCG